MFQRILVACLIMICLVFVVIYLNEQPETYTVGQVIIEEKVNKKGSNPLL